MLLDDPGRPEHLPGGGRVADGVVGQPVPGVPRRGVAVQLRRASGLFLVQAGAIKQAGGRAFIVGADLSVAGDVDTLFAGLKAGLAGRPLDILVNNAGGALGTGSIEETTPGEFDRLVALNVRAPFFIIQRALPLLRDGGRIINISSADARIAITRELAYSMAKGAINVLSRTLAHAVGGRGITVNTVAPGITDTERNAWIHTGPEMEARTASASALNRIGQPSDIADIVAFLASDDARWITGDLIDATGGTFLGPRI